MMLTMPSKNNLRHELECCELQSQNINPLQKGDDNFDLTSDMTDLGCQCCFFLYWNPEVAMAMDSCMDSKSPVAQASIRLYHPHRT